MRHKESRPPMPGIASGLVVLGAIIVARLLAAELMLNVWWSSAVAALLAVAGYSIAAFVWPRRKA